MWVKKNKSTIQRKYIFNEKELLTKKLSKVCQKIKLGKKKCANMVASFENGNIFSVCNDPSNCVWSTSKLGGNHPARCNIL